jgi:hypothetical protein
MPQVSTESGADATLVDSGADGAADRVAAAGVLVELMGVDICHHCGESGLHLLLLGSSAT